MVTYTELYAKNFVMELTSEQALQKGIEAHKAGKVQVANSYYNAILKANPKHPDANHNMGVLAVGVGKVKDALPFFKAALDANPNVAQFWLSYIDAFIKLDRMSNAKTVLDQAKSNGAKGNGFDKLEELIRSSPFQKSNAQDPPPKQLQSLINLYNQKKLKQVFEEAQILTKRFTKSVTLWNLLGASGAQIGHLDEAITAFQKAISIKPDHAKTYYNIGNALEDQGKPDEAIEAYKKALSLKPDYAEAYYNLGVTLKEHDQIDEAIETFTKALSIKPNFAKIHHSLSSIKTYTADDKHFLQLQKFFKNKGLSEDDRCHLSFTLANMYEDIGKLKQAYNYLLLGNALRKKLLNYSIDQDKNLFNELKKTQPYFYQNSLEIKETTTEPKPIFILGMPRSGTTLVEQIISLHSKVHGGGELNHVPEFGFKLASEPAHITTEAVFKFRENYLSKLSVVANGEQFVTDKMPQNFRFIPLICAALPEAKIIHVTRNATATCWSNFRQYFRSNGLGYCYDLKDVVDYYKLYKDLMTIWQSRYGTRIYNLNYEKLVNEQEKESRKLIGHLDLTWEEALLLPHKNKRTVKTASQQQVRQKVYKGSSEAWRKYERFLNSAFDSLPSS